MPDCEANLFAQQTGGGGLPPPSPPRPVRPCLGVTIDEFLTWAEHIDNVISCRRIRWLRSTNISARLHGTAGSTLTFRFTKFISHKYYTLITTIWSYTLRPLTILTKLAFVTTFLYNFCTETVPTYFHHAIHTIMLLTYFGLNSAITNLQLSLTYMRHAHN